MTHRGVKHAKEGVSKVHRGMKYFTEVVKDLTEGSKIPQRGLRNSRGYGIFHEGG